VPYPAAMASSTQTTRAAILAAAKQVLRIRGYAGLSTREVAAVANVPLSQIHYHFLSRVGLLIALFQDLTAQLHHRQQAMFADPSLTLAQRWERACDCLDEDLASGYVRTFVEMTTAAMSDPEIARVLREAHLGWIELIAATVERFRAQGGRIGSLPPRQIAAMVSAMFFGSSAFVLLEIEEHGLAVRAALRGVGDLIHLLESEPQPDVGGPKSGGTVERN
jgi:AcrR family transcriptional regulator